MGRRAEVSYNPQLGYLKTVFSHDFDFLVGIKNYMVTDDGVEFIVDTYKKDEAQVIINIINDKMVRFRMYPLCNTECFHNEVFNFTNLNNFTVNDVEDFIIISYKKLAVKVRKGPFEVSYYYDGKLVTKEQIADSNVDNMCKNLPIGFEFDENKKISKVHETMYMNSDEAFYGFGEKFTEFNKRGQKIDLWQVDALSTNSEKSYKAHPYFMSSKGYAILLNSFSKASFDMGKTSNVAYSMEVEDKYIDYILYINQDYKKLLEDYVESTEAVPMIPKWSFGLWMSKCVYMSQQEVIEVVERANKESVKIDVINLDAWQDRDDNGSWTWDLDRFPDPKGMIEYLKSNGIHLCLWIFPFISENSKIFKYAAEKEYLVKDETGNPIKFFSTAGSTSKVGCFDFTNPEFVKWYKPRVEEVISLGVGAVKTDFSEAVPENAVFYDGSNGIQGHNKLTYKYARTIYDIMKEIKTKTGERAMLWGRSGYAGSHAIPAAWAGDSSTHLNNHACILKGGLSAGMSGIMYWGFDMGGFYNTDHEGYECMPSDEEYIRSCQFGFLSSLSRCHGKTPREPWHYSEKAQAIFNKYNEFRHKLAPYLYTTAFQSSYYNVPMMRSMVMQYPDDPNCQYLGLEYMLGDSLLVAPVFDQDDFKVYLPEGIWTEFMTGESINGGRWIRPQITIEDIPVYLKENSIVPMLEKVPIDMEAKYKELIIYISIRDEIDAEYFDDDVKGRFRASNTGVLTINTDMPAKTIVAYTSKPIETVIVNGVKKQAIKEEVNKYRIYLN